ncbi:YcaO-like family protein [Devosia sp. Leaf420]|uniref:YcaO-like family protein n=1 Tax=Devosia sp. Leaf420 TaxID=1736374 RepID=UPI002379017D|nr:YcaO-like family protein [Devosia sp. Leaf420]
MEGLRRRHQPDEALSLIMPRLSEFGITRLAQQTNLDIIGIPCYAAIRPNSQTLSVHQGKGTTNATAKLSAIMEAVEFAVGERPQAPWVRASREDLTRDSRAFHWPDRQLPRGFECATDTQIQWLYGYRIGSRDPVLVPLDSVAIAPNAPEKLPFAQSSNGLAAGFGKAEAIAHGFFEVLERDASTLWALRSLNHCAKSALDLSRLDDDRILATLAKFRAAEIQVLVFDLTTDLGVPTMMALLWSGTPALFFDIASGVCTHPSPVRALLGALEEAAQTRISNIAGARDDIEPGDYSKPLPDWLPELIAKAHPQRGLPPAVAEGELSRLPNILGDSPIVVQLSAPNADISVVKVLSAKLEDRSTNVHWRPGARAIKTMTAL